MITLIPTSVSDDELSSNATLSKKSGEKGKGNKGKHEILGLHQDQKLLHNKGNS